MAAELATGLPIDRFQRFPQFDGVEAANREVKLTCTEGLKGAIPLNIDGASGVAAEEIGEFTEV
jgi:hypothetical protein